MSLRLHSHEIRGFLLSTVLASCLMPCVQSRRPTSQARKPLVACSNFLAQRTSLMAATTASPFLSRKASRSSRLMFILAQQQDGENNRQKQQEVDWEGEFSRVRQQREEDNKPINTLQKQGGKLLENAKNIDLKMPKFEGPGKEAGFNPEFNPTVLFAILALLAFATSLLQSWQATVATLK